MKYFDGRNLDVEGEIAHLSIVLRSLNNENKDKAEIIDVLKGALEFYAGNNILLERISGYSNATGKAKEALEKVKEMENDDEYKI